MKKRLLALIMCLVMMMSLLPITAAAAPVYTVKSVEIEADGVYLDENGYHLKITDWKIVCDEGTIDITDKNALTLSDFSNVDYSKPDNPSKEGTQYRAACTIGFNTIARGAFDWNNNEIPSCILRIPGYESVFDESIDLAGGGGPHFSSAFILTKEHDHDWRFTQTDSTLTGTCQKSTCPIKTIDVNLAADSVTLPNSPFQAQLVGLKQFQEEVPDAVIGDFVYKYKGPNGWNIIEPTAANVKAGEYQVGVRITIPSGNANGQDQIFDLFVKYTAADPKVTAQTGDDRPIELMMASVLVFSALAAAAFIVDSKRNNASL